jgi:hypothetical protein
MIVVISYSGNSPSVGGMRSKYICQELLKMGFDIYQFTKESSLKSAEKSTFMWGLCAAWRLLFLRSVESVFLTCGPFSSAPLICFVCKLRMMPLVVDFRDPWSFNILYKYDKNEYKHSWKYSIARELERYMYRQCDFFCVCTPGMHEMYERLFGDSRKLLLCLNGFTFDVAGLNCDTRDDDIVRIACLGGFVHGAVAPARIALRELEDAINRSGKEAFVSFIGTDVSMKELLFEEKFGFSYEVVDKLPYAQAIDFVRRYDMGLFSVRNERYEIGTKIYDYVGLGMKIYDFFSPSFKYRYLFEKNLTKTIMKKEPKDLSGRERYHRSASMGPLVSILARRGAGKD